MKHRRIRECIIREFGKLIRKDMKNICSKKVSSMLRKSTAEAMKSFAWDDLTNELEDTSPVFYRILKECVDRKRRKVSKRKTNTIDDTTVIGMCAALLLRHQNANMNLVKRIISVLHYSGHAPKKVIFLFSQISCCHDFLNQVFRRLQRLLVCLSHPSTISTIDELGKDHDAAVREWKGRLHQLMCASHVSVAPYV